MRSKYLSNPLFDRKILIATCLAGSLSLAMYLILGTRGLPPELAPESAEVVSDAEGVVIVETPYEQGFRTGYGAFLKQTGQYIPQPGVSVRYTSSYDGDENEEEVSRGYVDGYHKATDMMNCPQGYAR